MFLDFLLVSEFLRPPSDFCKKQYKLNYIDINTILLVLKTIYSYYKHKSITLNYTYIIQRV